MRIAVVAGAIANQPGNGGIVWEKMSWLCGLRRLGFHVYFCEQIDSGSCIDASGQHVPFERSIQSDWFARVMRRFGLTNASSLWLTNERRSVGLDHTETLTIAADAELLINISGHCTVEPLLSQFRRKIYLDVDPGYTQFWHADPATPFTVSGHDYYFTLAENIGQPDCPIPMQDIPWRTIRQPVVLDDWPVAAGDPECRFTTVGSWRGAFGQIIHDSISYGVKAHEFRKFIELPTFFVDDVHQPIFEVAMNISAGDAKDRERLIHSGWRLVEPSNIASDPDAFREYVQSSMAEWSVAQGMYVTGNTGWFSDRSVRYLASGRPVLVQDTRFSKYLPTGCGIIPFRSLGEAVAGVKSILRDYPAHCKMARSIAEEFFESDRVIAGLLRQVGIAF